MATKAQAERQMARFNITLDEIQVERLEGYFSTIDAPEGFYLNSTGIHFAAVQGYNMPEFWDSVVEDASPGISPCSDGGCEAQACNDD